jgi:hypothetical protein
MTNAIWEIEASRAVLPKDATVTACLAAPCNGKAYGCGCQVALSTGGLANNVPNFFPASELALFPRQPRLTSAALTCRSRVHNADFSTICARGGLFSRNKVGFNLIFPIRPTSAALTCRWRVHNADFSTIRARGGLFSRNKVGFNLIFPIRPTSAALTCRWRVHNADFSTIRARGGLVSRNKVGFNLIFPIRPTSAALACRWRVHNADFSTIRARGGLFSRNKVGFNLIPTSAPIRPRLPVEVGYIMLISALFEHTDCYFREIRLVSALFPRSSRTSGILPPILSRQPAICPTRQLQLPLLSSLISASIHEVQLLSLSRPKLHAATNRPLDTKPKGVIL